jgi:large subunit ribosomal protein L18
MAKSRLERKNPRTRAKMRTRTKAMGNDQRPRVCVFRSSKHIYAQIISDVSGKTLAQASTLDKEIAPLLAAAEKKSSKSVEAAKAVGALVGKRALSANIKQVKFDRNGFVYTGRIKALADGAREAGLDF